MLVLGQVVLNLQLPFAFLALGSLHQRSAIDGPYVNGRLLKTAARGLLGLIAIANLTLMWFWVS
jgi:manganese transport protein